MKLRLVRVLYNQNPYLSPCPLLPIGWAGGGGFETRFFGCHPFSNIPMLRVTDPRSGLSFPMLRDTVPRSGPNFQLLVCQAQRRPDRASSMAANKPKASVTGSGTAVMDRLQPFTVVWSPGTRSAKNSVHSPVGF